MTTIEKLTILTDAAKYDVACTSSGIDRGGKKGKLGSAVKMGICLSLIHIFSLEGYHDYLILGVFRGRDGNFHLRVYHRIKDVLEILSHVAVVVDRRSVQVQDRALFDEGCLLYTSRCV